MKVIYRSFNGLDFETKRECMEYERTHRWFKMYSSNGPTDDFDWAKAVVFQNEKGVANFIADCDAAMSPHDGLDESYGETFNDHPRVFLWDSGLQEYREIDYCMWNTLANIFREHIS